MNRGFMPVRRPDVEIRIDELVLDGFEHVDGGAVQAAVEAELARLVAERGLPPGWMGQADLGAIDAGAIEGASGQDGAVLGVQIAQALYGGMHRG